MTNLRLSFPLAFVLGCTQQPAPEPGERPAVGPAPDPAPVAPKPDPDALANVEMILSCGAPGTSGGSGFLEDAKRPIVTVILGHRCLQEDTVECCAVEPTVTVAAIALPRAFSSKRDLVTARALTGDFSRPMFTDECVHVVSCDDRNGDYQCGESPFEPLLARMPPRSRYLHASVSRPARFTLALGSRDERFCGDPSRRR